MRAFRLAVAVISLAALPAFADGGGTIGSGTRSDGGGTIGSGTRSDGGGAIGSGTLSAGGGTLGSGTRSDDGGMIGSGTRSASSGLIGSGTRSAGGMLGSGTRTAETCVATSTTDTTCRGGYLIGGGLRSADVGTGVSSNSEGGLVGSIGGRSGYMGSGNLSVRDAQPVVTVIENGDSAIIFLTLE